MTTSWNTAPKCFLKAWELKSQHLRSREKKGKHLLGWLSREWLCIYLQKGKLSESDQGGKSWVDAREAVKGKGPLGDGGIEMGQARLQVVVGFTS